MIATMFLWTGYLLVPGCLARSHRYGAACEIRGLSRSTSEPGAGRAAIISSRKSIEWPSRTAFVPPWVPISRWSMSPSAHAEHDDLLLLRSWRFLASSCALFFLRLLASRRKWLGLGATYAPY